MLSGTLVASLIVAFFVSPLDDIIFVSVASVFLSQVLPFNFGLVESVLVGCVIGLVVFAVLELRD